MWGKVRPRLVLGTWECGPWGIPEPGAGALFQIPPERRGGLSPHLVVLVTWERSPIQQSPGLGTANPGQSHRLG